MEIFKDSYQEIDIMQQLPVSQKSKNRVYLCWRNNNGIQCKMIGPQTKCFCNHRFKEHEYLKGVTPHCKDNKCKCKCFDYIPAHGAYDFKCLCKHSYKEHDCLSKKCSRSGCKNCTGFASAWTCSCGSKYIDHETIIETYEQRKEKGKDVNDMQRLNNQLNHVTQEGSLLKPINIKLDPQDRIKQKRQSALLRINAKFGQKNIKQENIRSQQDIEQYKIEDYGKK